MHEPNLTCSIYVFGVMTVSYEHAKHEYSGPVHESAFNNTAAGSANMQSRDKLVVGTRVRVLDFFRYEYALDCIVTFCDDDGVNHCDEVCYKSEGTVVGTTFQPRFAWDCTLVPSTSHVLVHFTDAKGQYHQVCDVDLTHLWSQYTQPMTPEEGCRVFLQQNNVLELEPFKFARIKKVMPNNETHNPGTSVLVENCSDQREWVATIGKDVVIVG